MIFLEFSLKFYVSNVFYAIEGIEEEIGVSVFLFTF